MDNKVKNLLVEYSKLSKKDQEEFKKELKDFDSKQLYEQRTYSEKLEKSLGPLFGAVCSVCGR